MNNVTKGGLTVLISILQITQIFGQTSDTTILDAENEGKRQRKISIIPMPVLATNPTMGLIYGVAPGFNWVNGDPSKTSMTSFLSTILYTTKNQLLLQLRGNLFTEGDKLLMMTDLRFNLNSQPTYGLGTNPKYYKTVGDNPTYPPADDELGKGPSEQEMMYFDHFRLYQTFLKRHQDTRFFYGLGYHLDIMSNINDKLLDLGATPPRETWHYQYQKEIGMPLDGYTQSGISLNASFDSRDNVANPYKGRYALAQYRINPSFLGSTESSGQLWLEYRDYLTLNNKRPRNLLAFWTYGWFVTGGKVPYMFLPATGWDMFGRSSRPHTMGRFRGEDLVYSEVEWRFPLQKNKDRLGAVLFLNTTTASSRTQDVKLFGFFGTGYGGGLRYMISPKNRVNIALDYGRGMNGASAIFLNLNEMF
jgi:hypothetical protein